MRSRPLVVIGLMSGTSADGIDGAVIRLPDGPGGLSGDAVLTAARAAVHHHVPFTPEQRRAVFALFDPARTTADQLCRLNFALGEWFAAAAVETAAAAAVDPAAVDLIGSHGQTIYHCPPGSAGPGPASTLQIGEPAVIAERTGATTVADFRVRDVAAGGHGAPLVSYVDALLFRAPHATRAVLNLGGIANVTILPPSARPTGATAGPTSPTTGAAGPTTDPVAFDTGPANMVVDWLARELSGGRHTYDPEGAIAAQGHPDSALLEELLADDYFAAPPPKTTGRERYGAHYAADVLQRARARCLSAADLMATATALTAESVARGIATFAGFGAPLEVIVGGGGARNPTLLRDIARRLAAQVGGTTASVTTHEAHGVSSQAKEALSFAILAAAAVRGIPNTLPSCTGAAAPVVMGKILPGRNYPALMARLFGGG
jgi:anhydro-N-acetylmuramic acid kinase